MTTQKWRVNAGSSEDPAPVSVSPGPVTVTVAGDPPPTGLKFKRINDQGSEFVKVIVFPRLQIRAKTDKRNKLKGNQTCNNHNAISKTNKQTTTKKKMKK